MHGFSITTSDIQRTCTDLCVFMAIFDINVCLSLLYIVDEGIACEKTVVLPKYYH